MLLKQLEMLKTIPDIELGVLQNINEPDCLEVSTSHLIVVDGLIRSQLQAARLLICLPREVIA